MFSAYFLDLILQESTVILNVHAVHKHHHIQKSMHPGYGHIGWGERERESIRPEQFDATAVPSQEQSTLA